MPRNKNVGISYLMAIGSGLLISPTTAIPLVIIEVLWLLYKEAGNSKSLQKSNAHQTTEKTADAEKKALADRFLDFYKISPPLVNGKKGLIDYFSDYIKRYHDFYKGLLWKNNDHQGRTISQPSISAPLVIPENHYQYKGEARLSRIFWGRDIIYFNNLRLMLD